MYSVQMRCTPHVAKRSVMNRTFRILSAAAISLAAFHAHAQVNGDDSSYPMSARSGTAAAPASAAAASMSPTAVQPYVWTGNEVGLVHNHSARPAAGTAHSAMPSGTRAPAGRPIDRSQGASERMPIYSGA